jgi:hypothetical protein
VDHQHPAASQSRGAAIQTVCLPTKLEATTCKVLQFCSQSGRGYNRRLKSNA